MIELHCKYRAHGSEAWVPVLVRRDEARFEIATHAGRVLAIWSGGHLEGLNFPLFGRQWLLRDQRVAESQLMVENDEDYAALREFAPQLPNPDRRALRQLWNAALENNMLAWIAVALLIPFLGLWFLFRGLP